MYELAGLELKIARIVREPTPILFAALHYTMNQHFDMDEMFELLIGLQTKVSNKPRSQQSGVQPPKHILILRLQALPHRPFSPDPKHQRTFVFALQYYTIVGEGW